MLFRDLHHPAAWLCAAALFASTSFAQPRSAPGAIYAPQKGEIAVGLMLPADAPARAIRLMTPVRDEPNAMTKAAVAVGVGKNRPLRVGFVRKLAESDRHVALASLPWQSLPDGSLIARLTVTSDTAAGVRVQLVLDGVADGVEARFQGTSGNGQVFAAGARDLKRAEGYWSPVLEGETAIIELRLPSGSDTAGDLIISGVGHMLVAGAALKRVEDIGHAGACEQDVACVLNPSTALLNAARSVAQTVAVDGGFLVLCNGTLLNSIPQSNVPYFMTAYHCYDEDHVRTEAEVQVVASSLTMYWFFDATGCGNKTPGAYQQVGGGATLLYRGQDIDFIFFRLNAAPPTGAWFSAWDATPMPSGTGAIVLHHPEGDLKKLTQGSTQGYASFDNLGSYIQAGYTSGSTEPGSSGAPLFTCHDASSGTCDEYRVRGALLGGNAACDYMAGTDVYSRLDLAYPYIANFLTPNVIFPSGDNVAVEYYNVNLDHFFVTAYAFEQDYVNIGNAGPGWFRTGSTFKTLSAGTGTASTATACRFYGSISPGPNSHFYTLDAGECQFLKDLQATTPATQPRWNYEGLAFANFIPNGGSCPAGTMPVYRYYNNGFPSRDSNHRFVTNLAVNAFMLDQGWSLEGVTMCAPN
jgi:lysyl endopeptidase